MTPGQGSGRCLPRARAPGPPRPPLTAWTHDVGALWVTVSLTDRIEAAREALLMPGEGVTLTQEGRWAGREGCTLWVLE